MSTFRWYVTRCEELPYATRSQLKNLTALTTLMQEMGVNLSNIPNSMTGSEIIEIEAG